MTAVREEPAPGQPVVREGEYGERVIAVEPGGAEFIPLRERHGRPGQLFWTWTSPNFEFATVFVGVIGVLYFGLSFWQSLVAIVLGTALGSITMGVLSARGPGSGVPQMILSRISFGHWGNALPAGLNAVTAGVGWFAVNSVSGAFALNTLLGWPKVACLVLVVVAQLLIAFFGHNLVHAFERYAFPVLAAAFILVSVVILAKFHAGGWFVPHPSSTGGLGGFLILTGAAFGYAAGWNPYASDYTRYFRPDTSKSATALWSAAGVFVSCVLLEAVGAASATLPLSPHLKNALPTAQFTGSLPTAIADIALIAIALGAIAANVLNIYSGALSFTALGIKLPLKYRRAAVALLAGIAGFITAIFGLHDAGAKYTNFLLLIAYWISPWLAVFFTDQFLRRREEVAGLLYDRSHRNWAGPVAMAVGAGLSIWAFSNQTEYVGWVPAHHPAVGDLTFEVGFVISAVLYAALYKIGSRRRKVLALPE
ncbi:MAG: purine-cytosine permease family protein [Mycobacteriales bacterium]